MIYFSGLVVCLLVLTAEAKSGSGSKAFCADAQQCLVYNVTCNTDDYEVRSYESVKVAATIVKASTLEKAQMIGYSRLLAYFNGSNDMGVCMDPVAPALVRVPHKKDSDYFIQLALPSEYQGEPPIPNDDLVFFIQSIPATYYIRGYHGKKTGENDQKESKSLSHDLDSAGASYIKEYHVSAIYNKPGPEGNMYNEVAFLVMGEPVCED
ncbi:heme-binding protein 1-like [Solea solea]|uniref:heme-binding protein 1-like n=1 Tax=Solea solea TaxID=90069 RepID=UPI00272AEAEF|nr:heme-binding protein 1-like [Solea solea]